MEYTIDSCEIAPLKRASTLLLETHRMERRSITQKLSLREIILLPIRVMVSKAQLTPFVYS